MTLTCALSAHLCCHPCLPPKEVNEQTLCEFVKQAAVFNLQTVCLVFWSRTIPAYVTSLQRGIGSSHATVSVSARGYNRAQSEPQSTQWWEFMLTVRCQVELF